MSSLTAYGKMNLVDQANHDARRRSRRRIAIIALSSVALVAVIIGAVIAGIHNRSGSSSDGTSKPTSSAALSIKAVCDTAVYPDSCYSTLSPLVNSTDPIDLPKLFHLSVQLAMSEVSHASALLDKLNSTGALDAFFAASVDSCKELLDMSVGSLNDTVSSGGDLATSAELVEDFKTWLSAAMTYEDTCLEGFENATAALRAVVAGYLRNSTEFSSNSLSILTFISDALGSVNLHRRRLMGFSINDGFPSWVSSGDRRLLQKDVDARASAAIVVAKDGSGKFTSIKAAIKAVPAKSARRTVIYVKKGVYSENVVVDKSKTNVMIVGDGKDATIITGSLNVVDGTPTFKTATLAVFGKGFIGRDFGVRNTAGPAKHQAVAMMSDSDQSVFYRCKFDGFQDTLYTHSLRQFYRECDVYGTVDFIFGNAAAVLQACNIFPRVPMQGQQCTLTAQGKTDRNMNTGTSIHACTVAPFGDLSGVRVFLGRPWKPYSTTVFMKTFLSSIISPAGWMPWTGNSAPSTIFYAEYLNTGPGASTRNRVKWKGLRALNANTAAAFTVGPFIGGNSWLPATGVPFNAGL